MYNVERDLDLSLEAAYLKYRCLHRSSGGGRKDYDRALQQGRGRQETRKVTNSRTPSVLRVLLLNFLLLF
jgi:hypothetical protein